MDDAERDRLHKQAQEDVKDIFERMTKVYPATPDLAASVLATVLGNLIGNGRYPGEHDPHCIRCHLKRVASYNMIVSTAALAVLLTDMEHDGERATDHFPFVSVSRDAL